MQNSGLQKDCVRDMNLFDLPLYSAEGHNGHLLPQAYRSHSPKGFPMMPKQTPNAVGYKVSGSYSFFLPGQLHRSHPASYKQTRARGKKSYIKVYWHLDLHLSPLFPLLPYSSFSRCTYSEWRQSYHLPYYNSRQQKHLTGV